MMKVNWKVRVRNPVFWATLIPAIVALAYTILGLFDVVPTLSENMAVNTATTLITALSTLGVLVDPTTSGFSDSSKALSYSTPFDSEISAKQEQMLSEVSANSSTSEVSQSSSLGGTADTSADGEVSVSEDSFDAMG
ncbi:MAG: phage holin [Clostridia bacterium]